MTRSGADQDQETRRRKVSMMIQVSGLAILRHCGWQTDAVAHRQWDIMADRNCGRQKLWQTGKGAVWQTGSNMAGRRSQQTLQQTDSGMYIMAVLSFELGLSVLDFFLAALEKISLQSWEAKSRKGTMGSRLVWQSDSKDRQTG